MNSMYFGNTAKTSQSYYQQRQKNNNPLMPLRTFNIQNRNINVPETQLQPEPPKDTKTMKWGEPTWFLLHTIAEKIRDESFSSIREELLQIICIFKWHKFQRDSNQRTIEKYVIYISQRCEC